LALTLTITSWEDDARAGEPGPDSLPITVIAVQTADAYDQAEALTAALRNAVRSMPGWSPGAGDYSLEVLSLSMKCPDPPDAACESRIADQIKADRYIWGIIGKKGGAISGSLHLWIRGKGTTKVDVNYSSNLTEPTDDALKKVASDALMTLTGGPPKGSLQIKAGDVPGQVFVDGQPIGALTAGEGMFSLPAGSHKVLVRAVGYADMESTVVVKPNATASISLSPSTTEADSPTNWRRIGGFIGLGSGVAFGAIGLYGSLRVFSIDGSSEFEKFRNQYPGEDDICTHEAEDAALADQCDTAATMEVVQLVFYPLAAVAGGVGLYLLLTSYSDDGDAPTTGFEVSPKIGQHGGKLDVSYRF
jgi:hypothetical protein